MVKRVIEHVRGGDAISHPRKLHKIDKEGKKAYDKEFSANKRLEKKREQLASTLLSISQPSKWVIQV
jgi:hypothetical protein